MASIPRTGFCLHVERRREERRDGIAYARTVGDYRCYWNGAPLPALTGQIVERGGPGDNGQRGVDEHRRIERGRYPLIVHAGTRYKTYDYAARGFPHPGIGLAGTATRTAILIHPVHHRNGWLSSIGCLNPTSGLVDASSRVGLADSRRRTIAIIDVMQQAMGDAFPRRGPIPDAVVIVDGEPS